MRHHADKEREQRLSAADVDVLQRDRSPQARAQVAAKFGRQFDELCGAGEQAVASAVLELLVRDLAVEVRQALASTVAASAKLPPAIARQLAGDEIEVAEPILQRSPVLGDEDLVRVVRTNAMQYALAVAGRERLSELVSEALVDTGHAEVVARLVDNAGAQHLAEHDAAGDPGLSRQRADPCPADPPAGAALRAGRAADRR